MGKKRYQGKYDAEALDAVALQIEQRRASLGTGEVSRINLDKGKLEEAIKQLPSKEREALESFAGLIPGTIKHYKKFSNSKHKNDPAFKKQVEAGYMAMQRLISAEYLVTFDSCAKDLIDKILKKFDKTHVEEMDDMECLKYYLAFMMFFLNGHQMIYQDPDEKIDAREINQTYEQYALLFSNWSKLLSDLPDGSIKIALMVELLGMFDLRDIVAIKRYVGLPIKKQDDQMFDEMPLRNFAEIRQLKEHMFPWGPWEIASYFVLAETTPQDLEDFAEFFNQLRSDWKSVEKYEVDTMEIEMTSGKKTLKVYQWREFRFTDIYEFMSLYVNRDYLV